MYGRSGKYIFLGRRQWCEWNLARYDRMANTYGMLTFSNYELERKFGKPDEFRGAKVIPVFLNDHLSVGV